ncbi:MAG: hypothetical protein DRO12_06360 [Thermoprotei archaeon]|nr:MAG: hypothetical protein DRO12_06360 [Thermoprotei archaeon]
MNVVPRALAKDGPQHPRSGENEKADLGEGTAEVIQDALLQSDENCSRRGRVCGAGAAAGI